MIDDNLKNLQGNARRKFLRWTTAMGAVLALDRSKVLNVINDSAGSAMADDASCAATNSGSVGFTALGSFFFAAASASVASAKSRP